MLTRVFDATMIMLLHHCNNEYIYYTSPNGERYSTSIVGVIAQYTYQLLHNSEDEACFMTHDMMLLSNTAI